MAARVLEDRVASEERGMAEWRAEAEAKACALRRSEDQRQEDRGRYAQEEAQSARFERQAEELERELGRLERNVEDQLDREARTYQVCEARAERKAASLEAELVEALRKAHRHDTNEERVRAALDQTEAVSGRLAAELEAELRSYERLEGAMDDRGAFVQSLQEDGGGASWSRR